MAETLLTLMILGVIASMTIPVLKKNVNEKQTIAALKKAYSTFSNAADLAQANEGPFKYWNWQTDITGASNRFFKYLNVETNCGINPGCWGNFNYKYFRGTGCGNFHNSSDRTKARLADGTSIYIIPMNNTCSSSYGPTEELGHVCAQLAIDINGEKPPNQLGIDTFYFWITAGGVIPVGTQSDTSFSNCRDVGYSCTAWALLNENMDYVDKDISW